jgi:hypothetical protein
MSLVQDEEVVAALAADSADEPFPSKGFCESARGAVRAWRIPMRVTRRVKASP